MNETEWRVELTREDKADLVAAMQHWDALGKPIHHLTTTDFPLSPALASKVAQWRRQLGDHGRGFQVIRGVPLDAWTEEQAEVFFWALGRHLGVTGAQDNSGELLGHVRDTGADPRTERQYKTNANIVLHCDAADVVGLLAVRTARVGGVSRLVSSVTVFNEMVRAPSGPAHLARLFQDVPLDTRGSGGINCLHLPPLRFDGAVLRTFWHQEYFRTVARHAGCGPLDPVLVAALDAYDQVADRPDLALNMELQRGDVQLVSNHFVLHARTGFEDWEDPALKRHLLRLWLSLDPPGTWHLRLLKELDRARMVVSLVRAKLFG